MRILLWGTAVVLLIVFGITMSQAGEPDHRRVDNRPPAPPVVVPVPKPNVYAPVTANGGAGGGGGAAALDSYSDTRIFSFGSAAAVSPAGCLSTWAGGILLWRDWNCDNTKNIIMFNQLGLREAALQEACRDSGKRQSIEAAYGRGTCKTEADPQSRWLNPPPREIGAP